MAFVLLASAAMTQTMNVVVGQVDYVFPAAQTGDMTYDTANTLTIGGRTFDVSSISSIYVDDAAVDDNTVVVKYNGSEASVVVAGNIARFIETTVSGADVQIVQADDVEEEISYRLSGSSTDGSFYLTGKYKATVIMDNLSLTSRSGAAVNIDNGKRIALELVGASSLTDAVEGSQKACFVVKGHPEVTGSGALVLTGNTKHAMKTGEYLQLKKKFTGSITVNAAVADGLHVGQYLEMNNGSIVVAQAGDDGIQIEANQEGEENDGQFIMNGGSIDLTVTAAVVKGIKADSTVTISDNLGYNTSILIQCSSDAIAAKGLKSGGNIAILGGDIRISTAGKGMWDSDDASTSACAAIKADGDIAVAGGTLNLSATGSGGKGLSADGALSVTGGDITVTTTGGLYYHNGTTERTNYTGDTDRLNSDYTSSPKGIKADGNIDITGGNISVTTKGNNAEGIESKMVMTIESGTVNVNAYDDGLNSKSHMYLKGGNITVVATNNDAIDSNGNLYISGGTVVACGASAPECGLDAAEQYKLYITGGNVLAIGGGNNAVSATEGSQPVLSITGSVSSGATVSVKSGSTQLVSFTVPEGYSSGNSGGGGHGPGGHGGGGSNVLITCDGLTTGSSYTVTLGSTSTSVTASTTTSENGPGGGHGW